jgi:hypothetical protein
MKQHHVRDRSILTLIWGQGKQTHKSLSQQDFAEVTPNAQNKELDKA